MSEVKDTLKFLASAEQSALEQALSGLTIEEAQQLLQRLEQAFKNRAEHSEVIEGSHVTIVIPSLAAHPEELAKIKGITHYEERQLWNLLQLKDPKLHIIFISSLPLDSNIIDYYISLIPENQETAKSRLVLFATYDTSYEALTSKLLSRPRLKRAILKQLQVRSKGTKPLLSCFFPTEFEHEIAKQFECTILASPPAVQYWGTKSGSRKIFKESGVPHPDGSYDSIWNSHDLSVALAELWDRIPKMNRAVVKLNDGFSGSGNALLDMGPISSRLYAHYKSIAVRSAEVTQEERIKAIHHELCKMRFQGHGETWEHFEKKIGELGCIVEEFIEGQGKQSPSVQAIIHLDGKIEILSSHEQILGGADGQVYLGCHFPCDVSYRSVLHKYSEQIAGKLVEKGALDRFGIDFLCVPHENSSEWDIYALEINLRSGGTTHPYETLRLLTGGFYNIDTGVYLSNKNQEKYYIATDNLKHDGYKVKIFTSMNYLSLQRWDDLI